MFRQIAKRRISICASKKQPNSVQNPFLFQPNPLLSTNFSTKSTMSEKVVKSEQEWRAILSPEQFRVLREKGTELPGTGEYDKFNKKGIYNCAACNLPLYESSTKFDAHCGWPAFYEAIPGSIVTKTDRSFGMERTEMMCSSCGGHLGHIFKGEGYNTPTDARHCVNSVSLKFKEE